MLTVFVPKETASGETRVAAVPETLAKMSQAGMEVLVEAGAGEGASLSDAELEASGAKIVPDPAAGYARADLVLQVAAPDADAVRQMKRGAVVVSLLFPHRHLEAVRAAAEAGISLFGMDLVPRITRAQKMDALSSQANLAGYKAVLLAANALGKYFPLLMTAAGTVRPARVVIFGAGVAGLQAIATAKRLGAVVEATDIRTEVREQVESLGGRFIQVGAQAKEGEGGYAAEASEEYKRKQAEAVAQHVADADVVITTALVPGRPAPRLLSEEMVRSMKAGSVIVDMAAAEGGNCPLTEPGQTVRKEGVTIVGETNIPALVPVHASELYARNVLQVVEHLVHEGAVRTDLDDEITAGSLAVHDGEIRHAPTAEALQSGASS